MIIDFLTKLRERIGSKPIPPHLQLAYENDLCDHEYDALYPGRRDRDDPSLPDDEDD
jgi:hypothetical protein